MKTELTLKEKAITEELKSKYIIQHEKDLEELEKLE